ncbi:MAG: hypothetical protein K2X91_04875, partial [Thermoleophilia bacterium]|nr:hypothetical protein [Thermoleophilia bacterium]
DLIRGATGAVRVGDPDARAVTRRFDLAWGVWKVAATGAGLMFATIWIAAALEPRGANRPMQPPDTFIAAALTFMLGFPLSAFLTAAGLRAAWRAGLRVWIGQGVNQARTLLLGMLVVGFTVVFLLPACFLLVPMAGAAGSSRARLGPVYALLFFGGMIGGPIVLLLILDWLSARILAATPSKFGPKAAAVGKWAAPGAVEGRVA